MAMHVETVWVESGTPSRRWSVLRAADRAAVLMYVSDLIDGQGARLTPGEVLDGVCEAAESHLSLLNVVFIRHVAGQSRVLAWSAPGASPASRMAATTAAALMEGAVGQPGSEAEDDGKVACASVHGERMGLSGLLYVESQRRLDDKDRALLDDLLRRMLGATDAGLREA